MGARLRGFPVDHQGSVGLGMTAATGNLSTELTLDRAAARHGIERENFALLQVFRFRSFRCGVQA